MANRNCLSVFQNLDRSEKKLSIVILISIVIADERYSLGILGSVSRTRSTLVDDKSLELWHLLV